MNLSELAISGQIPRHIAVIMDGNGRWAKNKGARRVFGHQNALKAVRETTEGCVELGVEFLTLFAFSTENWNRPKGEVDALMNLLVSTIRKETKTLMKNGVKLNSIGDIESLPKRCRRELEEALKITSSNSSMTLNLALSYSGRWDLIKAVKKIIGDGKSSDEINEELINRYLDTAGIPDPELMIRTSGEYRISNFLLWQLAYTELYFSDKFWPDFRKQDLADAVNSFQKRERRFGKTSEQVKA
jgi:undecaprenyl diphosphate synthase